MHKSATESSFKDNSPKDFSVSETETYNIVVKEKRLSIEKTDIEDFFNLEAEAASAKWEATMKLSIKDRIRKRKAIQDVYLDKDFSGKSEENYKLLKVTAKVNLADFKEGECLILHNVNSVVGIKCRLNSFENDDVIILEVFPPDMPSNLDMYYDTPLLLDKDKVDLRNNVLKFRI